MDLWHDTVSAIASQMPETVEDQFFIIKSIFVLHAFQQG